VIKIGDKLFGIPAAPDDSIATDLQQQTGRRFEEAVFELNGEVRWFEPCLASMVANRSIIY